MPKHQVGTRKEWPAARLELLEAEKEVCVRQRLMKSRETPDDAGKGAAMTGTDVATYARERPGMSALVLEDGIVYHTYSAYARGLDGLWCAYQWLDRAPNGRDEPDLWWRRHDEYDKR